MHLQGSAQSADANIVGNYLCPLDMGSVNCMRIRLRTGRLWFVQGLKVCNLPNQIIRLVFVELCECEQQQDTVCY